MITRPQTIEKPPVIKRILVRCPGTAKLTPTGQTIEESLFATMRLSSNKLNCPHCGQVHNWTKKDVVLAR
jgi:aspartate carbamoyltransferase regulatory subunit